MAGNFRTFAPTHLGLQQNVPAIAQIQLDAHRLLSIPVNQPLPPGFIRNTFVINLETIRDMENFQPLVADHRACKKRH